MSASRFRSFRAPVIAPLGGKHMVVPLLRRALPALVLTALILGASDPARAQGAVGLLARRYHEGDSLHYHMVATNRDRQRLLQYSADVDGVVQRDSLGRYVEVLEWSHLVRDNSVVHLSASGPAVRQRLTLEPGYMIVPDIPATDPALIGPVADLLGFYVDARLAAKLPLARVGDHVRVPGHQVGSWADGRTLLVAEDAVDFDVTLSAVDSVAGVARLIVRHSPSDSLRVQLKADWMRVPAYGTSNNWVQVSHEPSGAYRAAVGRETFDVELTVDLGDGRIRSATMVNPVDVLERMCSDEALTSCGEPRRYRILRRVAIH